MVQRLLQSASDSVRRIVTRPRHELGRWQRAARFGYDLCRYGAFQLRRDRAPQMAGALAFRTLFGLLPVLVVGTILVRAFRGTEHFRGRLEELLAGAGLDRIFVPTPEGVTETLSLSQWLMELVGEAEKVNLAAVGWIGLAVLIYSAIGLMVTIENSFNAIVRAPEARGWTRRLTIYWTVLSLAPLAIGLMVFLNSRFALWIDSVPAWSWLLAAAPVVWNFVVVWLLLLCVYLLVPNASVGLRHGLAGAFVSALLVTIGFRSLGAYLTNAISIRHLYGSLGLVPLFMFWVYVMWLVILFGLEVAATLRLLRGRRINALEPRQASVGVVDPAAVIVLMEQVAVRFAEGRAITADTLSEATGIPDRTVSRMIDALVAGGFLHRLESERSTVALARAPQDIDAAKLLEVGYDLVPAGSGVSSELLERLRAAQRQAAAAVALRGAQAKA